MPINFSDLETDTHQAPEFIGVALKFVQHPKEESGKILDFTVSIPIADAIKFLKEKLSTKAL